MAAQAHSPIATFADSANSAENAAGILDTYVKEGSTQNFSHDERLWISNTNYYGNRLTYLKVVDLPRLGANHFITSAKLCVRNVYAPTADTAIMCTEVLEDWNPETITYATQPKVSGVYQDYCRVLKNQYSWKEFDVTSLARKWLSLIHISRGYVFDEETGFYYVSSRYYDPEIGRFISPDTTDVLTATPMGLTDKNLYAYCDNNPVVRVDHGGQFWETVFDVISLGASIVEVCINPTDPWAWAGLAGDAIDLIPFVTGVGEVTRAVKTIDKVTDTVQIAKAVDFTDDAADIVKTLDRSSGFTKSTASAGRRIHAGYKATDNFSSIGKEYRRINGIRPDYIDFNTRTIYELKPMNPRGVRSGICQLQKYNKELGGGFNLRLELY